MPNYIASPRNLTSFPEKAGFRITNTQKKQWSYDSHTERLVQSFAERSQKVDHVQGVRGDEHTEDSFLEYWFRLRAPGREQHTPSMGKFGQSAICFINAVSLQELDELSKNNI